MATISALSSSLHCQSCLLSAPSLRLSSPPSLASFPSLRLARSLSLSRSQRRRPFPSFGRAVRAVAEEETLVPEEEQAAEAAAEAAAAASEEESPSADQTVSVPVSPSDMLTILFKAEGTMVESAIPAVAKALEGTEGVGDLKVQVAEGIASVELTKQTTVQATGVASNLVEIIQGSGFKLQTLNLSFEDEEDAIN
ncbi:uncharacterized protein LOC103706976 [Phoenix dactylifera]|uniref:Uncharacterized protein LOC103706976 n=1 Tax=Phoenix dactylifera TaxID=42345 RepID=A0A8B7C112_PHODC|nr:uncharacterized protein LOC103706976 [Phoenix dactylifera]